MADVSAGEPRKALLTAALLCALTVSGCAGAPRPADPAARTAAAAGPHVPAHGAGGSRNGATASNGRLNATDIGWIQLTAALDDQARRILRLAPGRTGDTGLGHWAAGLAEDHRLELAVLRSLLADAGVPDDNPHEGHDMPGMVSPRELRALETARGPRFDRLLRSALHEHLAQKRKLATAVRKADAGPQVKKAALAVGASAADAQRRMPAA
jgi:hypothetical protein